MKTSSSGGGMSKNSPYISWWGMTIGCGTPAAIGWPGSTVQITSRSPPSSDRHLRVQHVEPHPIQDSGMHAVHHLVGDLLVRIVTPPRQDIGFFECLGCQAVLWFFERGEPEAHASPQLAPQSIRDRA